MSKHSESNYASRLISVVLKYMSIQIIVRRFPTLTQVMKPDPGDFVGYFPCVDGFSCPFQEATHYPDTTVVNFHYGRV